MCGIAGIVNSNKAPDELENIGSLMIKQLHHRGPDGSGIKIINKKDQRNILFAHTRLSIIDLSERASQPMSNVNRDIWITFNGEIYNYAEIRKELSVEGYKFRTDSDTEVIIHAYKHWGINCFKKFIGMWAIALWDQERERFILSRDRLGIKPLYYSFDGESLIFGSEPKVILEQDPSKRKLNLNALSDYLSYRYVLDGSSFFSGIEAVSSGTNMILQDGNLKEEKFWQLPIIKEKEDPGETSARESLS